MIQMNLTQAAPILQAEEIPLHSQTSFQGISIDTRSLQPGNLFIALKGIQNDGHHFIEDAYQKGAAAAVVMQETSSSLPQLVVPDTVLALGQLTSAWRKQFSLPIIAVTGSNGKTTLKNMIAAILLAARNGKQQEVLSTIGTLNNHLGLPLTLAKLSHDHHYAVLEMGMNHFGEIEYLSKLAQPSVAVITNAAAAHLEGVGDVAGAARAKAEIFSGLSLKGTCVLNRDDPFFSFWLASAKGRPCITFGIHEEAHVRAIVHATTTIQKLTLQTTKGNIPINLPLLGKHNVQNMLAAAAATLAIGINLETIKKGLESILPAKGRLELHTLQNGAVIIDDTYNANPFSLQAAVDTLSTFSGKKILVLGDMKELGQEANQLHQLAGENIRKSGIDFLFTYGELSLHSAEQFGEGAYHFNEHAKLIHALKPFLSQQITILVKGSRSMKMEKIVAGLLETVY